MMDCNKPEDPRAKSNRYSKGARAKFDKDHFDFAFTQFLIDDNYVGKPPNVQVSIDNLNDNIDENFLKKDLTKLGKIRTLEIIRHPRTGQHLGLAKVQFEDVSVAQACVENFHGKHIMGRQLNVFKDLRFAIIEKIKEAKLNPRPPPLQKPTLPTIPTLPAPILPNASLHHSHLNQHQPIIPLHHPHLQKANSIGPIPSPLSLEYPITSVGSSSATPEPTSRQRLEDRIAILMKQPNCVLSTIVAPTAPQASPTYSAFSLSETNYDYANSSYYHSSNASLKALDKSRAELSDHHHRRSDTNNHSNHYQNHKELYRKYEKVNNKSDRYSDHNSDDEWNKLPERIEPQPLNLELSEEQIENEVLPHCYAEFYKELSKNLLTTIFKKLRENHGYQCLEKAQTAHKAKLDRINAEREKERMEHEQQKQFEQRYMSKARVELKPTEAPRPRVNLIRQRTSDYSMIQDNKRRGEADLRRVNRSSAYVAEPERRGSHNTSIDSEFSDSDSSSSGLSPSSSSSRSSSPSSSSSRSSSPSSRGSASSFSQSSDDSGQISIDRMKIERNDTYTKIESINDASKMTLGSLETRTDPSEITMNSETKDDEEIAISALLCMAGETGDNKQSSGYNDAKNSSLAFEDDDDEIVKRPPKSTSKKRKKKTAEVIGVASEYRATKRFASDPSIVLAGSYDENIENAMIDDENFLEGKPEPKFKFPERSEAEKKRMLDDLYGTLSEEDLKYLMEVHQNEDYDNDVKITIPFGSENANKAHLNLRKHMIEGKAAEGHPKWWRGCSRCDVIEVSEKEKIENEEMNYEDLTKAPIKSHVIQAVGNSSRRDQRGDQRRIAVLNSNLDADIIKMYTTSTLQMRAKNLRFSRSKIHKWGLFACEKIASGDAVIEYVGEKIRPSLADHREKIVYTNLPTHDGSSYFFRVDYDVIDATLKGNKARFINHSCNPNCIAKVIKHDNGSNSIVIYAKQVIQEDEEITYDYKFPREETDQKIQCNCKAPNCQKFLN